MGDIAKESRAARRARILDERFAEQHRELRDSKTLVPATVVIAAMAALPSLPGVRGAAPTPLRYTAAWGLAAVVLMWLGRALLHRAGAASASYRAFDLVESTVYCVGTSALVGLGGQAASVWWFVALATLMLAATSFGTNLSDGLVVLGTSLAAPAVLAARGTLHEALAALLVGVMVAIAWWIVARGANNAIDAQTERDELRERVAELEADRERRQLVRELHDGVGSALSLAALYGDALARGELAGDDVARLAQGLRGSAQDGLDDLRATLHALSPDTSRDRPLVASLEDVARRMREAAGVEVALAIGDGLDVVPIAGLEASVRLSFVRVFQEALRNAVRHGGARRVEAKLTLVDRVVALEVADDGRGLAAGFVDGRGLSGMRQRVAELGGSFEVRAGERGTVLVFRAPLASGERAARTS